MGRPTKREQTNRKIAAALTKLSPEVVKKLEEAFAMDCTVSEACLYAGISRTTYYEWIKDRFLNLRAELYWKSAEWLKQGNKLIGRGSFDEILDVRWKTQSDRKIKIKPKEEMREEGIDSPDVADALMLSFAKEGYSADVKDDTNDLFERHGIFPSVTR